MEDEKLLDEKLGFISGRTKISSFSFSAIDIQKISYGQYVVVKDKKTGELVLAQIVDIEAAGGTGLAKCNVLGKIHDFKLVGLRRPVTSSSDVYMPSKELLEKIISGGMPEKRILIGKILTHPEFVPVHFNPEDLARHMLVVATTGGGKSYTLGVIIEEVLEFAKKESEDYAILIFDVHNEYGGLLLPNDDEKQIEELKRYNYEPKGYADQIFIFDWEYNPPILSDVFTPDRLMFLYQMKELRYGLTLKSLMKDMKQADLETLIALVETSDLHKETKRALTSRMKSLKESGLVGKNAIDIKSILKPGYATIFRLANVPMGEIGLRFFIADILKALYEAYKRREILFRTIIVIDEAHLFAPRKGKQDPVKEMVVRIAREGRKYGLWLILATQGSRDLSTEILINTGTVLALKMQREDVNELSRIFDVPKGVAESLTRVSPGKGYLKAPSLAIPVMIAVRPKRTLDVKNKPEIIKRVEEAVEKAAKETAKLFKRIEKTKKIVGKTKEIHPLVREVVEEKALPEVKIEEVQKPALQEVKIIPKKEEIKPKEKVKKTKAIEVSKIVEWISEELSSLNLSSLSLLRELIENDFLHLSNVLSRYDDLIAIEPLKKLSLVMETMGLLRFTPDIYIRRRFMLKMPYHRAKELIKDALELI